MSADGTSRVATSVPSASGTRSSGACAPHDGRRGAGTTSGSRAAVRARVVGREEGADDELARLDRRHARCRPPRRCRSTRGPSASARVDRLNAAVRPQVRAADARRRQADDRVGRLDDRRVGAVLEPDVARTVENSCLAWSSSSQRSFTSYCSSVTCSIHSTSLPSSCLLDGDVGHRGRRRRAVPVLLAGREPDDVARRISSIGPPSRCTRPRPEVTISVCPSGWVCHAVRAPGSKVTVAPAARAGAGAVEERIDADGAGEPVGRSFARRLRARACDVHGCLPRREG